MSGEGNATELPVLPLDLDHDEQDTSLLDWITTNVAEPKALTREILESSWEAAFPGMFTRQFEVGPEDLFPERR